MYGRWIISIGYVLLNLSVVDKTTDVGLSSYVYIEGRWGHGVQRHLQQYFNYIVAVSFIGGGNRSTRRKPPTCRKSLTNFIT
jgi:hypothetical protein